MAQEQTTPTRTAIVVEPDEGAALWFNNDLLTLKATTADTGGGLLLIEELARGGKVTPLHVHPDSAETFYVLEGELLFHVDGRESTLGPGGVASVPAGVPHAYLVVSEVARSLVVVTPGSAALEAFFHDAGEPATERRLPPAGPLDIERIGAAAKRTGAVEILGPPPFGAR